MRELNFNDTIDKEQDLLDSLIWANISHNVENGNYTLEEAKRLFPNQSALIDAIYACEGAKRGFGDE